MKQELQLLQASLGLQVVDTVAEVELCLAGADPFRPRYSHNFPFSAFPVLYRS